jgi:aminoglycoside phosphotransferase
MLRLSKSIQENLTFLIAETESYIGSLERYVIDHNAAARRRILERGGYSYNLKIRIQNSCWASQKAKGSTTRRLRLQAIESIAQDLDRINELARTVVEHLDSIDQPESFDAEPFKPIFKQCKLGVVQITKTLETEETQAAIALSRVADKIEKRHQKIEAACIAQVRRSVARDFAAVLLAASALAQIGRALYRISESLLSAILGQAINFERFYSLEAVSNDLETDGRNIEIQTIAETRSGSGISAVKTAGSDEVSAIFKDGEKKKLKEERQGFEAWHEIYPGLAPQVLSYKKRGDSAALLIEHLNGLTFEHILLNESDALLERALKRLMQTLRSVWRETRESKPAHAHYMTQLEKRLPDILSLHPDFERPDRQICGAVVPGLRTLITAAKQREVASPFSVYIHGDFNLDNILYDASDNKINFIDLHRSRYMDYVQDISVMMVSCYRLQVLEPPERARILGLALDIAKFSKRFARRENDTTFEFRLALGLARSLITSTRFILDPTLSSRMLLRARFLLERIQNLPVGQEARFRLPLKDLLNE